ncbi:hypothetical protein HID58_053913 [Brassica napus]|uniref:Uncharacterized protein n=1 Tax=Brassica napus TaxID=3708 RepID=A0ABQ8AG05_BRANA|nr:hypothetical protein HID58_053913 [Brassica napus]
MIHSELRFWLINFWQPRTTTKGSFVIGLELLLIYDQLHSSILQSTDGSMCVSFSSSDWQLGFPTAVHKEYFRLSRAVATRKISSSLQYDAHQQVLIINTHFLFHYDSTLSMILQYAEHIRRTSISVQRLNSKRGPVYQFLKPQGFVLTTLLISTEIQKRTRSLFFFIMIKLWVCCIFFCHFGFTVGMPHESLGKFLQTSWSKACLWQISSSFSYVEECFLHQNYLCKAFMGQFYRLPPLTCDDFALQYLLRRASLTAEDAFAFLKITTMMVTQFMDLLIHLRVFT